MGRVLHPTHDVYIVRDAGVREVVGRCVIATAPLAKARGLLLTERPPAGWGALLTRCSSVHTWGMSFPLDIIYLKRIDPEEVDLEWQRIDPEAVALDSKWMPPGALDLGDVEPRRVAPLAVEEVAECSAASVRRGSERLHPSIPAYYSVVSVRARVRPWKLPKGCRRATDVLELASSQPAEITDAGIRIEAGDLLEIRPQRWWLNTR